MRLPVIRYQVLVFVASKEMLNEGSACISENLMPQLGSITIFAEEECKISMTAHLPTEEKSYNEYFLF
jgi:hypothetical protein